MASACRAGKQQQEELCLYPNLKLASIKKEERTKQNQTQTPHAASQTILKRLKIFHCNNCAIL